MKTNMRLWSVRGAVSLEDQGGGTTGLQNQLIVRVDELLSNMFLKNEIDTENCVHIMFTQTPDIDFINAASAARSGKHADSISKIPLFCAQEPEYPESLPLTLRVMVSYYREINHQPQPVYLYGARELRKDLFGG
jgi:chorismate mutase